MEQGFIVSTPDGLTTIVREAVEQAIGLAVKNGTEIANRMGLWDQKPQDLLLTFNEIRLQLRCSAPTLRKLITSGRLKACKVGNRWRVRQSDLDQFMEERS